LVVVLLLIADKAPVAVKLTADMFVTSISSTTPALAGNCPAAHMTTAARAKRQPEEERARNEKLLQSMTSYPSDSPSAATLQRWPPGDQGST
jgi:hypothetical protein